MLIKSSFQTCHSMCVSQSQTMILKQWRYIYWCYLIRSWPWCCAGVRCNVHSMIPFIAQGCEATRIPFKMPIHQSSVSSSSVLTTLWAWLTSFLVGWYPVPKKMWSECSRVLEKWPVKPPHKDQQPKLAMKHYNISKSELLCKKDQKGSLLGILFWTKCCCEGLSYHRSPMFTGPTGASCTANARHLGTFSTPWAPWAHLSLDFGGYKLLPVGPPNCGHKAVHGRTLQRQGRHAEPKRST